MPLCATAFLCGILFFQTLTHLPTLKWIIVLVFLFIFLIKIKYKKIRLYTRFFAILIIGFIWCFCYLHLRAYSSFPNELEGKKINITGYIASIPISDERRTHFLLSLDSLNNQSTKGLISLTIPKAINLKAGETWMFIVKLKKIHGTENPGGFDYEAWAFAKGITANGYVLAEQNDLKLLKKNGWNHPILSLRQYLHDEILAALPLSQTSHWIMALAIGERENISLNDWRILQNTGTNHLMAIAGLHIGLMSFFIYGVVSFCWRRLFFCVIRLPAQSAGAIAALIMAFIYSLMAGFSIPTERAFLSLSIFLGANLLRRNLTSWNTWSLALIIVLLFDPMSILTDSIWLSFGSVALIIYGMSGRGQIKNIWWRHGRIQWVLSLGLIPITIGLFKKCSLLAFFANSIAIPCVGFIIIPCTVLGCVLLTICNSAGSFLLIVGDKVLNFLWIFLSYLANLSFSIWQKDLPMCWIIIASFGVILLLLPRGLKFKWLGVIWILPLVFYKAPEPKWGDAVFTLLDVGQGLSAVIQTKKHILVFDTGVKFNENFDMGKSVVLPFLQTIGAKKIDMLVISHRDNDHSGGAAAILQEMNVLQLKSSAPQFFKNAQYCLQGEKWNWDGVEFAFLYPTRKTLNLDNNSSCVLRVTIGKQHILLTGDIEKWAEKKLIINAKDALPADILVAPHHGSHTSAPLFFVTAVHPKIVLFPVGYRNQYHFPNPSVVKIYTDHHSIMYDSVSNGAIQFYLNGQDVPKPHLYRNEHLHYWN